jgi:exodeoxyribonuclease V alpha subunit
VLCGARRGPLGVEHFNDLIDDRLKIQSFDLTAVGRAVLITVNAPRVRLVNGDIGLVVNTDDGVRVAFPDLGDPNQPAGAFAEGVRYLSPAELPEYERAYAMTVHKSQGSEYARDVVVILPQPGSPLLTRELVYTAVTRARSQVTLVGSVAAFAEALANPSARVSGLALMVGAGDAPSA